MHTRILGIVVLALGAGSAHADPVAEPVTRWLGTPSGTALPVVGSFYLHATDAAWTSPPIVIRFGDHPGRATLVPVSAEVIRVDYVSAGASELDVTLGDAHVVYPIDPAWQPEPAPRALQYWHDYSPWACGWNDSLMMQLDQPMAAVVATWTSGGTTQEWLVPARTRADLPGVGVVDLGKVDCGSVTLPPSELVAGGELALTAIRFDGSRVAVRGLPAHLATSDMPTTSDSLGHALKMDPEVTDRAERVRAPLSAPPQVPAGWNPFAGLDDALGLALAGGGVMAFGLLLFFRRRPALRDPNGMP